MTSEQKLKRIFQKENFSSIEDIIKFFKNSGEFLINKKTYPNILIIDTNFVYEIKVRYTEEETIYFLSVFRMLMNEIDHKTREEFKKMKETLKLPPRFRRFLK